MNQYNRMDSCEQFYATNTLSVLLLGLTGKFVQVEMKNETVASGYLEEADGYGNVKLKEAKVTTVRGESFNSSSTFIKASWIRYIHLEKNCRPGKVMSDQLKVYKRLINFREDKKRLSKLDDPADFKYGDESEDDL